MPALGMAQESGVLIRWLVAEGDTVAAGDPLMEVETDKAVVEVPATSSGTLAAVAFGEGAEVAVGTVLAVLLSPDDAPEAVPRSGSGSSLGSASPAAASGAIDLPSSAASLPAATQAHVASSRMDTTPSGTAKVILASPKAKRLARELGLDLATIVGTGPQGAVRAVDLPVAGVTSTSGDLPTRPVSDDLTASGTNPAASTNTAWLRTSLDAAGLDEFLARVTRSLADKVTADAFFRGAPAGAGAVTIGVADVLTRAVAAGLSHNATLGGESLRLRLTVNGVAGASAVLTSGHTVSMLAIARARPDQVGAAQHGSLWVEVVDNSDEVFERSSSPIDDTTAVRLTLGPIKDAVVVHDGMPTVRRLTTLSLEYRTCALADDEAAQLLSYVSRILVDPFSLAVLG